MKRAFTLAELLITFGIIGVVAALTMPALNVSIAKNTAATQFMKAFSTLQTVNDAVMTNAGGKELWDACEADNEQSLSEWMWLNCVERHLKGYKELLPHPVTYPAMNEATTYVKDSGSNSYVYTTKDNIVILPFNLQKFGGAAGSTNEINFPRIIIDINGIDKGPNILGQDAFSVIINSINGDVYAYGSKQLEAEMISAGAWNSTENHSLTWLAKCNRDSVADSSFCAGSIYDNNGKIIYPW